MQQAEMPLYRLLGLPRRAVPTSVTVGILPEDIARERTLEILERTGACYLKIKLGSQNGIDADKTMFAAVRESAAAFDVGLRVDANGGWNVSDAKHMMRWLQERGCDYVEQPLNSALPRDIRVSGDSNDPSMGPSLCSMPVLVQEPHIA